MMCRGRDGRKSCLEVAEIPIKIPSPDSQHLGTMWRLNRMQLPIRPLASSLARSVAMVGLAALLILWLLPAAVAAQAAAAV
jgi:hypothetical protein